MDESAQRAAEESNEERFLQLVTAYGQDVWNLAFAVTKSPHHSDDIMQDVFLKAYRSLPLFRGESAIKTWLLAITRNQAINYVKTAFMRRVTLAWELPNTATSPSAELEALRCSYLADICQIVMELPEKLRDVIVLHARHGLGINEIAGVLNISSGTVKSRLSRARTKLAHSRMKKAAGDCACPL